MQKASRTIQLTKDKGDLIRYLISENGNITRNAAHSRFQIKNYPIIDLCSTTKRNQSHETLHYVEKISYSFTSGFNQSTLTVFHDVSLQIKEWLLFYFKKKIGSSSLTIL